MRPPNERQCAGFHEAGHAILAFVFGRRIGAVETNRDGSGGVRCATLRANARDRFSRAEWRRLVTQEIFICYAGPVAEMCASGTMRPELWAVDIETAREWFRELRADPRRARPIALQITRDLLSAPRTWRAVEMIAAHLVKRGRLSGEQLEAVCRACGVQRV